MTIFFTAVLLLSSSDHPVDPSAFQVGQRWSVCCNPKMKFQAQKACEAINLKVLPTTVEGRYITVEITPTTKVNEILRLPKRSKAIVEVEPKKRKK